MQLRSLLPLALVGACSVLWWTQTGELWGSGSTAAIPAPAPAPLPAAIAPTTAAPLTGGSPGSSGPRHGEGPQSSQPPSADAPPPAPADAAAVPADTAPVIDAAAAARKAAATAARTASAATAAAAGVLSLVPDLFKGREAELQEALCCAEGCRSRTQGFGSFGGTAAGDDLPDVILGDRCGHSTNQKGVPCA